MQPTSQTETAIASALTSDVQACVNSYLTQHGENAALHYLKTEGREKDEKFMLKCIGYLVSKGANVNAKDEQGSTTLHYATFYGNVEVVKFLVTHGADLSAKNANGLPPFHLTQSVEVAEFLLSQVEDVNAKDHYGRTPLHVVQSVEVAAFLLSQGANVNAKDNYGTIPIHWIQSVEIATFLVSQGADVNAKEENGATPLHFAVTWKNACMATWDENTHAVVSKEITDPALVQFLVSKGADINAKTDGGSTPLHSVWDIEIAKFLISQGADVNAKDNEGKTPLDNAAARGNTVLAEYLSGLK